MMTAVTQAELAAAARKPLLAFSTDEIPQEQRFDHWRETRGRAMFGVTIELDPALRTGFHGRFVSREIGGAVLTDMQAQAYRVRRTSSDIAQRSSDCLAISLQVKGPGWLETRNGQSHAVSNGGMVVSYSGEPCAATPSSSNDFVFQILTIPLAAFPALAPCADGLRPEPLNQPQQQRLRFLATGLFRQICEMAEQPAQRDERAIVEHLATLTLMARGRIGKRSAGGSDALRAGCFRAAQETIAAHLRQPGLSAETVAAALDISVRQLHLLFEPSGRSFARTVSAERLKKAAWLLRDKPQRPVAAIATDCGFDSLATFYRLFKQTYGMAPNELRDSFGHQH